MYVQTTYCPYCVSNMLYSTISTLGTGRHSCVFSALLEGVSVVGRGVAHAIASSKTGSMGIGTACGIGCNGRVGTWAIEGVAMVAGMEVSKVEGAAMGFLSTEDVMAAVAATRFSGFSSTGDVVVAVVTSPWDALVPATAFTGSGDTAAVSKGVSAAGECQDCLLDVPGVVGG